MILSSVYGKILLYKLYKHHIKYRTMPECPVCKGSHPESSGLRLFQSENECPVCLEKCAEMMALPCGHQFCKKDLEKLGFCSSQPKVTRRRSNVIRRHRPLARIMRHIETRLRIRRRVTPVLRRRCGWCGHLGHTRRKCKAHQSQCGCKTYKSLKHKRLFGRKALCVRCGKKGHSPRTCHIVMGGRP